MMAFPAVVALAEPIGINSPGGEVQNATKTQELTELDLAINAEGSELHFETGGAFSFSPAAWEEDEAIMNAYGERTVAYAEMPGDVPMNTVMIAGIKCDGENMEIVNDAMLPWIGNQEYENCYVTLDDGDHLFRESNIYISANCSIDDRGTSTQLTTELMELTEGQVISFTYLTSLLEGYDYFSFYVNDQIVLQLSETSRLTEYAYTIPKDGEYTFAWRLERAAEVPSDLEAMGTISLVVDVEAGDALCFDWRRSGDTLYYELFVDGQYALSTVINGSYYGDRTCKIESDVFVFPNSGSHLVEWRFYSAPFFDQYYRHYRLSGNGDGNEVFTCFLDEVRIKYANEIEAENAELNEALNVEGGTLKFYSSGRSRWIAEVGVSGHPLAAEPDYMHMDLMPTYDTKVSTTVYMKAGWSFTYFNGSRVEQSAAFVTINGVFYFYPNDLQWFCGLGRTDTGMKYWTYTAPEDGYYTFAFHYYGTGNSGDIWLSIDDAYITKNGDDSESLDPYLNAALNVEGGDIKFFCPDLAYSDGYTGDTEAIPFAQTIIDGRYVSVNTEQGNQWNYSEIGSEYYPSAVSARVYMSEGSQLKFDYRLSCEEFDYFLFLINGDPAEGFAALEAEAQVINGSRDWSTYTWTAPADGEYLLCWDYIVDYRGSCGYDSLWIDNVELIGVIYPDTQLSELAQAMNATGCTLDYVNDSEYPWIAAEYDGAACGKSNHTDDTDSEHQSYITAEVEMSAGDTLSFDYLVSSEFDIDFFNFYVNDTHVLARSGETGWQHYSYSAAETGTYTFKWEYRRDDCDHEGDDCVYIKNVSCTGTPVSQRSFDAVTSISVLAQSMNAAGCILDYSNDSEYPWIAAEYDGVPVGKSNHTDDTDSQHQSYITTNVEMAIGDTLSFDYLVSSEYDIDFFNFYVNDTHVLAQSGETGWKHYSYTAADAGNYTFKWEYRRDDCDHEGDDCVYVKNVYCTAALGDPGEIFEPYDPALGEAISGEVPVLFYNDPNAHWTACDEYAMSDNAGLGGTTAYTETELYLEADTIISFDYMVSSAEGDTFSAYISKDGERVAMIENISGEVGWTSFSYVTTENGVFTISFEYSKDEDGDGGNDCTCIRNFNITMKSMSCEPSTQEQLNEALNVEGGELNFSTYGAYQFVAVMDDGRYYAEATNVDEAATECVLKTTVYLDADHVLLYDALHQGAESASDFDYGIIYVTGDGVSLRRYFSNSTQFQTYCIYIEEPGYYDVTWVYYMDRTEIPKVCEFKLDNIRVLDLTEVHEYDGMLHGDSYSKYSWYAYDLIEGTASREADSPGGFNMITGAYCPEDGNIYGYAYYGSNGFGNNYAMPAIIDANSYAAYGGMDTASVHSLDTDVWAMTYNIGDSTMYGISYTGRLFTISTDTAMNTTELGQLQQGADGATFLTLASDTSGWLYAVDNSGILYRIDPETVTAEEIGDTGLTNENGYFISMVYDNVTGKLYMTNIPSSSELGCIYEIDLLTAEATLVMGEVGQVTCLFTYTPQNIWDYITMGDVNFSGTVNLEDATRIMRYAMNLIDFTADQQMLADMNGSESISISDVIAAMRISLGLN